MAFVHGPLEASVLGRGTLQWGMQPEGTKMDKLLDSLGALRWDRPGSTGESSTEERTDGSRVKEMLEGYGGNTHHYRPGVCRAWRDPHEIAEGATLECRTGREPCP